MLYTAGVEVPGCLSRNKSRHTTPLVGAVTSFGHPGRLLGLGTLHRQLSSEPSVGFDGDEGTRV